MKAKRQATTRRSGKADLRFVQQYLSLKAKMDTAFDRWAAATPAAANAAEGEYRVLMQQMRALTSR